MAGENQPDGKDGIGSPSHPGRNRHVGVKVGRSRAPGRLGSDRLARLSVAIQVTAVAAERADDPDFVQYLRGRGIDHDGPIDWQQWFTSRAGSFTHVIVMPTGLHSSARKWIDLTQPGALKIVFWPTSPE